MLWLKRPSLPESSNNKAPESLAPSAARTMAQLCSPVQVCNRKLHKHVLFQATDPVCNVEFENLQKRATPVSDEKRTWSLEKLLRSCFQDIQSLSKGGRVSFVSILLSDPGSERKKACLGVGIRKLILKVAKYWYDAHLQCADQAKIHGKCVKMSKAPHFA